MIPTHKYPIPILLLDWYPINDFKSENTLDEKKKPSYYPHLGILNPY